MKSCQVIQRMLWFQRSFTTRLLLNRQVGQIFKIPRVLQRTETKARSHEVWKNSNSHDMGARSNTGWRGINNGHNT